jgi:hypothetical protein
MLPTARRLAAATTKSSLNSSRFLKPRAPRRPKAAPPRLDEKEQAIFEALQKASTGAFSSSNPELLEKALVEAAQRTKAEEQAGGSNAAVKVETSTQSTGQEPARTEPTIKASSSGAELHPDVRRGAKNEFEGEVNPVTGEVGGPKKEPLRWGSGGDWSYNGRVTDF